jgi:peptidoglycan/xylan/chitin deacetylase (PgdA/CDA1 family)
VIKRILSLLISVLTYCIDELHTQFCKLTGKEPPSKYIVLYYHAVREEQRDRFARQLDEIIRSAQPFRIDAKHASPDGMHHVAITFDDGFASFLQNALPELIKRDMPFTVFVPTGYLGKSPGWIKTGLQQFQSERVMNEEELRALKMLKIASIGSHCVTHRDLRTRTNDEARNEILQSKSDLENILRQKITTLSFPHGGYHQTHIEYAKQAGYERVFSIIPSQAFQTRNDFITGRIKCDPDDWLLEFRLKFLGAYRWSRSASNIKTRIRKIFYHSV